MVAQTLHIDFPLMHEYHITKDYCRKKRSTIINV